MGSYCSVHNDTNMELYIVYGPNDLGIGLGKIFSELLGYLFLIPTDGESLEVLLDVDAILDIIDNLNNVVDATLDAIQIAAGKAGLHHISPGVKYTSEKLTLSLVIQANVVVIEKNSDGKTITAYTGSFTTWTGPTANSTNEYQLSEYLSKLKKQTLIPTTNK